MKHKLFDFPHRAIRNLMFRISPELSKCESFDDFKPIIQLTYDLQFLLDNHLVTEDEIIVPHLSPELIIASDDEHHEIEDLQQKLFCFLYALDDTNFKTEQYNAELMFNFFAGKYLLHMYHEETEFQNYIWANYSTEQQEQIVIKIITKFTAEENRIWMKYGLPYVHQNVRIERIEKLNPVFSDDQILELINGMKKQLNEKHYSELAEQFVR